MIKSMLMEWDGMTNADAADQVASLLYGVAGPASRMGDDTVWIPAADGMVVITGYSSAGSRSPAAVADWLGTLSYSGSVVMRGGMVEVSDGTRYCWIVPWPLFREWMDRYGSGDYGDDEATA